ncbi:MAG TPA: site-specific integrase [Chlamydiales bacterium]|nr:site-specific integrase [Chlamydiales bacterium]
MASIKKRKTSKGISYQAQIRDNDGHPPKGKNFSTLQEAKDWIKDEQARRRQETYFPDQAKKKHILAELIDLYIEEILPSKPKNEIDTKRHLAWWKDKIGKYTLNLISYDLIDKCRKELIQGITTKGTQRNPATVNRYMAALSVVFTYGFKQRGWLKENPLLRFSKLRESRGRERIPTKEELDHLFESCKQSKNKHLHSIVILAISTGMRQGEILGLTWDNVDLEGKSLHLKETKNGRGRSVPLVDQALHFFHQLYQARLPHQQFVFPGKTRFTIISIRKAWDEAVKRAGIDNLHFHDLRHLFCTLAAQIASNTSQLAIATGHQSPSMMMRYTHQDANHTRALSEGVMVKLQKTGTPHDTE